MSHNTRKVVIGDRGRLVLPAEVRDELGLGAGSQMLISTQKDGSLLLRPYASVAESGRGMLKGKVPPGESMVDDLLDDRRREADREDRV